MAVKSFKTVLQKFNKHLMGKASLYSDYLEFYKKMVESSIKNRAKCSYIIRTHLKITSELPSYC